METKQKPRKQKRKTGFTSIAVLLLLLAVVAFGAGYGVMAFNLDEKALLAFRAWFGSGDPETVLPPPQETRDPSDNQDEPSVQPEKPEDPEPGTAGPDPNQETGEEPDPNGAAEPEVPIIYVDQVLLIPSSGGGGLASSQVVERGTLSTGEKQIALTFDTGWLFEQTIPLLDVLDRYDVTATFFPRALWVKDHPELAQEIARRGHTLGNHSLTHPHMKAMSADEIRAEIRESAAIIQQVTGVKPYLFRPPYGEYNNTVLEILAEEGYPYTIMWSVDTLDWAAGTTMAVNGKQVFIDTEFIIDRVLNSASANGIVLMHIGGPSTVEALPRIIEGLQDQGYNFATVDEMLPRPEGGPIHHTVKKGETLYSIARRYGVSIEEIIAYNQLD